MLVYTRIQGFGGGGSCLDASLMMLAEEEEDDGGWIKGKAIGAATISRDYLIYP